MGLGNYASGWGAVDEADDDYNSDAMGNGSDSDNRMSDAERLYRFRFSVPEPSPDPRKRQQNMVCHGEPATKRFLFLSGDPFCVWEHALWRVDRALAVMGGFNAICLKKNGLFGRCPTCEDKRYASFVGFFSGIDMGQVEYIDGKVKLHHEYWEDRKGERHYRKFQNCLLAAKRGSRDKPGVLKTLQREKNILMQEKGIEDLTGTVWDTTRPGKKSAAIGEHWRFVRKLAPDEIEEYLISFGADKSELDLRVPVFSFEDPASPFHIEPERYAEKMGYLFGGDNGGWGNNNGQRSGGGWRPDSRPQGQASGASYEQSGQDDDIPF